MQAKEDILESSPKTTAALLNQGTLGQGLQDLSSFTWHRSAMTLVFSKLTQEHGATSQMVRYEFPQACENQSLPKGVQSLKGRG